MMLKRGRYNSERNSQLVGVASKEIGTNSSCYRHGRVLSTQNKSANNIKPEEIYSQPQLVRPKKGHNNRSKVKYADSMNKFRREFIQNSFTNYNYPTGSKEIAKVIQKRDQIENEIGFGVGIEELHYQMVRLNQNVKLMHNQT